MRNTETHGISPYPVYKATGASWLGEVPGHWETERLKQHVNDVNEQTRERLPSDVYIALENVESWTGKITGAEDDVSFDSQVKRFQAGDVLFGKLRPYLAKVTAPNKAGLCVGEFLVLRCHQGQLSPEFLELLMRSKQVIDAVDASTFGAKMPRANWDFIGNMLSPVPPLDEQAAIVRYLDDADQRIRAYVSAKERLIALLEEERQAVIHQAVTKGLDPNVKLKPSGVEWLGDVPEHWEVTRLKKVATIQAGLTLGKAYKSTELIERPYLRVANVQSGHLDLSEITTVQVPLADVKKTTLEIGDVLMTEGGDIDKLGRGCMWQGEIPGCLHQNHVFAVRPNPTDLKPALLEALMGTMQGRNYFHATAKQTTNLAATNRTTLGEFPMCLPSIREQQAIVEHVTKESSTRDAAIDRARRQIELIEEYRTRLIADVVTGKIDVREAKP